MATTYFYSKKHNDILKSKFGFACDDVDYGFDESIYYFTLQNTPEEVTDPFTKQPNDNLSYAAVCLYDPDYKWEYDSGTYINNGRSSYSGWLSEPGYVLEDFNCKNDVEYFFDGEEITKEQYIELNGLTAEELDKHVKDMIDAAKDDYEDYVRDNAIHEDE